MRSSLGRGLGVLLVAAIWTCAAPAGAEDDAATRAAARKLAEDGVAALQSGDSAKAVEKLDKALQTLRVPSIALWSGRALLKHGQLVEAAERFLEATHLPSSGDAAVQEQAKVDAEKELEQLRPRIPNLVIRIEGGGEAEVSLDGKVVPAALLGEDRPVNPGVHRLLAKRGAEEQSESVSIAEGERKEVTLRFANPTLAIPADTKPQPPEPIASERPKTGGRTLAFVALGVGGAGLVLGGVAGALAMSKKSSLEDSNDCRGDECLYTVEDDVSSLRTFRTLSTVGFIAGGALAATGVVLLLTSDGSARTEPVTRTTLALKVTPQQLQLRGSF